MIWSGKCERDEEQHSFQGSLIPDLSGLRWRRAQGVRGWPGQGCQDVNQRHQSCYYPNITRNWPEQESWSLEKWKYRIITGVAQRALTCAGMADSMSLVCTLDISPWSNMYKYNYPAFSHEPRLPANTKIILFPLLHDTWTSLLMSNAYVHCSK